MGSIGNPPLNILIVGAGPVGLALALDLGRRGVPSTIIERQPGTGDAISAKASVLNERTMEFCRMWGVRDDVHTSGFPNDLAGDTVFCTGLNGRYIGRLEMPSANDREVPAQSAEMLQRCPQFLFDPLLARAVVRTGLTDVRYGVELVGCEQDEAGVTCSVRHVQDGTEEQLRARYVVACDGPASAARKAVGIPFEGKDLGHTLSAILRLNNLEQHHAFGAAERFMFIGPGGTWGNFTTIDGRSLIRFSVVGGDSKVANPDVHALVRKALGRDDIDYELIRVVQWRRSQYTAARYGQGRVILAGDSAHTMSPTGGHGLNTGLGDVMDLSWMLQALLEGWGGPGLLAAYQTERRPIAIRNGLGSPRNFGLWTDGQGRDKVLDSGPEADEQRHAIGEKMARNLRQEFQSLGLALGYSYADSPLVVPDGSPAPPDEPEVYVQTARPGHRAPHCGLEDGRSMIVLFGGGFFLLCFGDETRGNQRLVDAARKVKLPLECVNVTETEAAKLYENRLVLVRPDGMVAWRGDALPANVEELLNRVRGVSTAAKENVFIPCT